MLSRSSLKRRKSSRFKTKMFSIDLDYHYFDDLNIIMLKIYNFEFFVVY